MTFCNVKSYTRYLKCAYRFLSGIVVCIIILNGLILGSGSLLLCNFHINLDKGSVYRSPKGRRLYSLKRVLA